MPGRACIPARRRFAGGFRSDRVLCPQKLSLRQSDQRSGHPKLRLESDLETAVRLSDRSIADLGALGFGYGLAGHRNDAFAILKELAEKYARHEARPLDIAAVYTGLGDTDQAFVWLEKGYQENSGTLGYLNWDIYFDSLCSDSRYADLIRRMSTQ
jgi:hypothetical protein